MACLPDQGPHICSLGSTCLHAKADMLKEAKHDLEVVHRHEEKCGLCRLHT
jgi:hypothetical protein